ncbi:MAG TPA: DUF6569 family protein [Ktedonobacterales bacterium]
MPEDLSHANAKNERSAVATAVRDLVEGVYAGEPLRAGGLTLIPLLPTSEQVKRRTGYLPLEEALRRGLVTVTEQAQATVPELIATSTAETPVVLVGGEQVIGGLQNRVLNTTILVAAHVTQTIPVTCVEAGRWHATRADFTSFDAFDAPVAMDGADGIAENIAQGPGSPTPRRARSARAFTSDEAAYAKLRRMHAKSVTASLSSGGGYRSDQSAVWNEVAERMATTGSFSASSAMDTLYKTPERASRLKEAMEALKRPEGALGFLALVGKDVLGAEVFADETLADAYWEKLARSYAVEAMDMSDMSDMGAPGDTKAAEDTEGQSDKAATTDEVRLLTEALAADIQVHPSPGLGVDARLVGERVSGAGLVYDGAVVHLTLFPEDASDGEGQPPPIQRHYGGHRSFVV